MRSPTKHERASTPNTHTRMQLSLSAPYNRIGIVLCACVPFRIGVTINNNCISLIRITLIENERELKQQKLHEHDNNKQSKQNQ